MGQRAQDRVLGEKVPWDNKLWKRLHGQWRTDTRRYTAGQSSARLHSTPGTSTSGKGAEIVPALS